MLQATLTLLQPCDSSLVTKIHNLSGPICVGGGEYSTCAAYQDGVVED